MGVARSQGTGGAMTAPKWHRELFISGAVCPLARQLNVGLEAPVTERRGRSIRSPRPSPHRHQFDPGCLLDRGLHRHIGPRAALMIAAEPKAKHPYVPVALTSCDWLDELFLSDSEPLCPLQSDRKRGSTAARMRGPPHRKRALHRAGAATTGPIRRRRSCDCLSIRQPRLTETAAPLRLNRV